MNFAHTLEEVVIETVEGGVTKDLMLIAVPKVEKYALTEEFIDVVAGRLREKINK